MHIDNMMSHQSVTEMRLCFTCAAVFDDQSLPSQSCPSCGALIEAERYAHLLQYAYDAGRFGYQYTLRFEQDLKDEDTARTQYYLVPLGDALVFCALAALSGIVGNAAYNTVKLAIKKILNQIHKPDTTHQQTFIAEMQTEEGLQRFLDYVAKYHHDFKGLDRRVVLAVIEELIVDRATKMLPPSIPEDFGSERYIRENRARIAPVQKPNPNDFRDFWTEL